MIESIPQSFDETAIRVWVARMNNRTRGKFAVVILVTALVAAGCSKSKTPEVSTATPQPSARPATTTSAPSAPATVSTPVADSYACSLLTTEEIQAVQGEAVKSTKASQGFAPGMTVSQCYFELPTTSNSIVITVTRKAEGGRDPSQSWQDIFHPQNPRERKEEEEKDKGPEKVEGVGDEAFWTGNRVGGALYVLKGNSYVRISVGGAGDQPKKIEKSKALAESILKRL
jgi:hypothetical protein